MLKKTYRLIIISIIGYLLKACIPIHKSSSDSEFYLTEQELKTYFNLFPNINEIEIIRLAPELGLNLKSDYYSRQELDYFHRNPLLTSFLDSVEHVFQRKDSIRIEQQLIDNTFQKEHRTTYLSYIPATSPDSLTNKKVIRNYILNFDPESKFSKSIFYPFVKNYYQLEWTKQTLEREIQWHLLDNFWFKILEKSHLEKVKNIRVKFDRSGRKIKYTSIEAERLLVEETGEPLYQKTAKRYFEILDSLDALNRFDNPKFIGDDLFWVRIHGSEIYVSPFLLRSAYLSSMKNKASMLLSLAWSNKVSFTYYADLVVPTLNHSTSEEADLIVNILSFKSDFYSKFSFAIGHELAHAYLGNKSVMFQNETACDCYAAVYLKTYYDDLISINKNTQIISDQFDYELGLYKEFLIKSIDENVYRIWGLDNSDVLASLKERNAFLTNLRENPDFKDCHGITP